MAAILFIALMGIVFLLTVFEGFVLKTMWAWFIVPTFGLPPLTVPVAIGICLIVAFLTHQQNMRIKSGDDLKDTANSLGYSFFTSAFIFFAGWVATLFM